MTTVSEIKASNLVPSPAQLTHTAPIPRPPRNEVATLPVRPNNQPLALIKQINEEVTMYFLIVRIVYGMCPNESQSPNI